MIKITIKQKIGLILFGIFLTLVFLEIGLRVGGFVLLSIQKNKNKVIESGDNIYRILCLGESTTANLYNGQSSWPSELENILNKGYKIKFKMFNVGITATDTTRILNQLEDDLDTYEPHMVITMMGINDLLYNNTHPHFQFQKRISNRILFFENFRVYKLFKLLWLHSNAKIKELKFKEISHINLDDKHILKFEGNVKNLMNDQNYLELAVFYQNRKMFEEAEEMFKKSDEIKIKYYKPETQENYRKLYQKLKEKEIKLVVMQYPTRDINEFKMMFEGDENIIFVSNENNFKEALKTYEYENLFIDHFAGDFGHCTKKGNILIAENVANIILKYFKIN